jgi:hypothetical protein
MNLAKSRAFIIFETLASYTTLDMLEIHSPSCYIQKPRSSFIKNLVRFNLELCSGGHPGEYQKEDERRQGGGALTWIKTYPNLTRSDKSVFTTF